MTGLGSGRPIRTGVYALVAVIAGISSAGYELAKESPSSAETPAALTDETPAVPSAGKVTSRPLVVPIQPTLEMGNSTLEGKKPVGAPGIEESNVSPLSRPDEMGAMSPAGQLQLETERKLATGQALDALLVEQTPDPAWQSRMGDATQYAMQDALFALSALEELQCGSSICRMTLSHATEQSRDAFLDTLLPVAGFRKSADVVVIHNMDGSSTERVTYYVSQDGGSLPSVASSFGPEFAQ